MKKDPIYYTWSFKLTEAAHMAVSKIRNNRDSLSLEADGLRLFAEFAYLEFCDDPTLLTFHKKMIKSHGFDYLFQNELFLIEEK